MEVSSLKGESCFVFEPPPASDMRAYEVAACVSLAQGQAFFAISGSCRAQFERHSRGLISGLG